MISLQQHLVKLKSSLYIRFDNLHKFMPIVSTSKYHG